MTDELTGYRASPHPAHADQASEALVHAFVGHIGAHRWTIHETGLAALITGSTSTAFNAVWMLDHRANSLDIDHVIEQFVSSDVPFQVQARPSVQALAETTARRHGLEAVGTASLMACLTLDALPTPSISSFRRLRPIDATALTDLSDRVFNLAAGTTSAALPSTFFNSNQVIACVDTDEEGRAIVGGIAIIHDDAVGLFNIATERNHRCRGLGTAVTLHLLHEARSAGARWAYLQASEEGFRVYQRNNFELLELWTIWQRSV